MFSNQVDLDDIESEILENLKDRSIVLIGDEGLDKFIQMTLADKKREGSLVYLTDAPD